MVMKKRIDLYTLHFEDNIFSCQTAEGTVSAENGQASLATAIMGALFGEDYKGCHISDAGSTPLNICPGNYEYPILQFTVDRKKQTKTHTQQTHETEVHDDYPYSNVFMDFSDCRSGIIVCIEPKTKLTNSTRTLAGHLESFLNTRLDMSLGQAKICPIRLTGDFWSDIKFYTRKNFPLKRLTLETSGDAIELPADASEEVKLRYQEGKKMLELFRKYNTSFETTNKDEHAFDQFKEDFSFIINIVSRFGYKVSAHVGRYTITSGDQPILSVNIDEELVNQEKKPTGDDYTKKLKEWLQEVRQDVAAIQQSREAVSKFAETNINNAEKNEKTSTSA